MHRKFTPHYSLAFLIFITNLFLFSCKDSGGPIGPVPIIETFTPAFGAEGTAVTITGQNFGSDDRNIKIYFTSSSGGQIESVLNGSGSSSTTRMLYTSVPQGAVSGKIYVSVNGVTGPSQTLFEVLTPASDLTISPISGSINGSMVITGATFSTVSNENLVTFATASGGRISTTSRVSADGKYLIARIPQGAASGSVQVTINKDLHAGKDNFVLRPCNVSTYAGAGSGSADGALSVARFAGIGGMVIQSNIMYLVDGGNHRIRKIDLTTGTVSTLAGSTYGYADGTGTAAQFNSPGGIVMGKDGKLYVADTWNECIRKVDPITGQVTTVAGTVNLYGNVDAVGTAARLRLPTGMALAADGMIYFSESSDSHRIRKFDPTTGAVSTIAGTGTNGSQNGTGVNASFFLPEDLVVVGNSLYIADNGNELIRKIDLSTKAVTTIAGGNPQFYSSEDGLGVMSAFNDPTGIVSDGNYLYVSDAGYIRRIDLKNYAVTTLAGTLSISFSPVNGECGSSQFETTGTMVLTDTGTLYVGELSGFDIDLFLIRKIIL